MKNRYLIGIYWVLVSTLMTGCSVTPEIESAAFGKAKKFAIVSVTAYPDIQEILGRKGASIASSIEAAASEDRGFSKDAQALLDESATIFSDALQKSKSFRLIPAQNIQNSHSYKNADPVPLKVTPFSDALSASGYKSFDLIRSAQKSQPAIKEIVTENRLDGAITIHSSFNYEKDGGVSLFGLAEFGGDATGIVTVDVRALDRNGNEIWSQRVRKKSAETIELSSGTVSFSELEPILEKLTRKIAEDLVLFVDNNVAMR